LNWRTACALGSQSVSKAVTSRSIRWTTETPTYPDPDIFLLDGKPLLDMGAGRYRQHIDEGHQRIRRMEQGWEVTEKDGTIYWLGITANSREPVPGDVAAPLGWLVEEERDTTGNLVRYQYLHDGGSVYLERIEYASYRVELHYEERPDVLVDRSTGFAQQTSYPRIPLHRTGTRNTVCARLPPWPDR
jgi:hypothetical protein